MLVSIKDIAKAFKVDESKIPNNYEYEVVRDFDHYPNGKFRKEVLITNSNNKYLPDAKDCIIIITNVFSESSKSENSNLIISTYRSYSATLSILFNLGVNVPGGIDESKLVYRNLPNLNSKIERVLFANEEKNFKYLGYNTLIGITGDVKYGMTPSTLLGIGGVVIGKNVHIGSNVIIYRGILGMTEIADDSWISDNCIIHHDTYINGHCKSFKEY